MIAKKKPAAPKPTEPDTVVARPDPFAPQPPPETGVHRGDVTPNVKRGA